MSKRDFRTKLFELIEHSITKEKEDPRSIISCLFAGMTETSLLFTDDHSLEQIEKALNGLFHICIQSLRSELKNKENKK